MSLPRHVYMADEAFALSPISARATLPSEEDYDAIREAFMETSRGRWFLGEYAKRNRNADTRMVLDVVERIEETLAAQHLATQNLAAQRQPEPAPDNGLAEALAAIRSALDEARAAASSTIDGLALEQNLAPVRKGARVIKEIAWRLREIGADSRICDLIDSQVNAIEGACGEISSADPKGALSEAFGLIEGRIEEFDERDAAAPTPQAASKATPSPSPSAAASDEMPAAAVEELQTQATTDDAEIAMSSPAMPVKTVVATSVTVEAVVVTAEAAARDEAVLDLVALEMAAPDPFDADDLSDSETGEISAAEPAGLEITAPAPEPVTAPQPAAVRASTQPPLQPVLERPREPSLGSTILAAGIVQKPNVSASDPLAPIRRMSQAEKIAFFS